MENMQITPVRLPIKLVKEINLLIKKGFYINKSDVIRDAVRRLVLNTMIEIIPNTGNSVKEIKELRKKLSKEKFDLDKINKLNKK